MQTPSRVFSIVACDDPLTCLQLNDPLFGRGDWCCALMTIARTTLVRRFPDAVAVPRILLLCIGNGASQQLQADECGPWRV
ncbi:hypothetical protein [Undibacterium sp. CCC3.4]|nr:hypothetical protein [Undibacterium sp. CCC3.4]WPX44362.1 hypothetical protein RHM61_03780 [Undibacterium sp. CCC3.4]